MAWRLAYELLKPWGWKRLAEYWFFTKEQVSAIEQQWTGATTHNDWTGLGKYYDIKPLLSKDCKPVTVGGELKKLNIKNKINCSIP